MTDLQRLIDGFDAGELVRPFSGTSLVDLARAMASVCGVDDVPMTDASRALAEPLGETEHLVFVMADGLGTRFVNALPDGSWLRQNVRRTILAPYPPTTPVALTTIATGHYPSEHAITGWWTHLPSLGAGVTVFHNSRATDEVSLDDLGVPFAEVCPRSTLMPRMTREVALVMPSNITDTPFTHYMSGGQPVVAYGRHADAAQTIADRIPRASGPTFTYWYTPFPDTLAHEFGSSEQRVQRSVEDLDDAVGLLTTTLRERDIAARIVVTADHGHLDVRAGGHFEITGSDPLLAYLECPPTGDVRTQYWHVRRGMHRDFGRTFRDRFGKCFLLLHIEDVEDQRLFGPDPLSAETRARIGDFVSISLGPEVLRYTGGPGRERYLAQQSHHSGLSAAEMIVPLVIIETEADAPA